MVELHSFGVAVSRMVVNHDGHGSAALDAVNWDDGSTLQRCSAFTRVIIDLASFQTPWVLGQTVDLYASFLFLLRMSLSGPTV